MNIAKNIKDFLKELPETVTLVAVSKTKPNADIKEAYGAGQRIFGENKVQEMTEKWEQLPKDIQWHMVGHVQTNKVKYMAPYVSLIHSADRIKLFKEINKRAKNEDRSIDVLLQVKIAEEDSKFGMERKEAEELLSGKRLEDFEHVNVVGLMGMATFTDDSAQVEKEFKILHELYARFKDAHAFTVLSMGMSGDYKLGLKHGSTMVRVGTSIFGERNYD